ncbi:Crp/Fnr family transcriptional regulator [Mesobaculum littorinae]|uniref:Crp/Fnr family transcriptional regulator n=1 Tax=Mesobaculum littorinae TaxID=2486419 RepID=A0A438AHV2_9RHOB|nr:Crp/Fnr family transcriptional regulator [Mesobaculum littorinae]RVV98177.1 Crp/Fnr family transcriptional regulator [Mesobaculum littorinae]
MPTKCEACPLRGKSLFLPFAGEELAFMQRFKAGELSVEPGSQILMEGANSPQLFTVLRGLGLRYKTLPDGRRQVVNFIFPGDFLGMQAGLMGEMRHSVEATTQMTLCVFNRSDIWSLFRSQPHRAFDMTWLSAVEESFLGEALTRIGQQSAVERICWALLRIYYRADQLGMVHDGGMALPYRQQDLADALGLSLVHTNKTLAKLRESQLASWQDGRLRINDPDALARIAGMEGEEIARRPLM